MVQAVRRKHQSHPGKVRLLVVRLLVVTLRVVRLLGVRLLVVTLLVVTLLVATLLVVTILVVRLLVVTLLAILAFLALFGTLAVTFLFFARACHDDVTLDKLARDDATFAASHDDALVPEI